MKKLTKLIKIKSEKQTLKVFYGIGFEQKASLFIQGPGGNIIEQSNSKREHWVAHK